MILVVVLAASALAGEKSASDLAKDLASPDVTVRRAAVYELHLLGADSRVAAPAVVGALRDTDEYVRKTAAYILNAHPTRVADAVPGLIAALADPRVEVRRYAAALLRHVPDRSVVMSDIVKALGDADPVVRRGAVRACVSVPASSSGTVLPGLIDCAKRGPASLRSAALAVLAILRRPEGKPPAVAALGDESWEVREAALKVLIALPGGPGVPFSTIAPLLEDEHWRPRRRAVFLLEKIEGDEVESAAVVALGDEHDGVRVAAAVALGRRAPVSEKALAALGEALSDGAGFVRQEAAIAIGFHGERARSLAPALARCLEAGGSKQIRYSVADSLDRVAGADDATIAAFRMDAGRDRCAAAAFSAVALLRRRPDDAPTVRVIAENFSDGDYARCVARFLGEMGPAAGAVLVPIAKRAEEATGDVAAAHAYILLRVGEGPVGPAVERMIAAFEETEGRRRRNVVCLLGYLGPDAALAVPTLLKAWNSGDLTLRMTALTALTDIGPTAKAAIPTLVEARRVAAPHMEWLLDQAIRKIRGEGAR
jgi:HEAT repeat protein